MTAQRQIKYSAFPKNKKEVSLMKNTKKRITAFIMAIVVTAGILPAFAFAKDTPDYTYQTFSGMKDTDLTIAAVSDLHYYSEKLRGDEEEAYREFVKSSPMAVDVSVEGFDAALETLKTELKDKENPCLVVTGDITLQGEYYSAADVAEKLKKWEKDTGIDVIVINGNHDINSKNACSFEDNSRKPAKNISPEEFMSLFAELGYDLAYHTFTPLSGKHGMCSYSVRLDGGYRLIMMDTSVYTADVTKNSRDENETGALMTKELFEWVKNECEDAKKSGEKIIGATHCNIIEHLNSQQEELFGSFILKDWEYCSGELADSGMHYVFSGHQHQGDIASYVSDNGEIIYECSVPPVSTFPAGMYVAEFASRDGKIAAEFNYCDSDKDCPVVLDGVKQEQPLKYLSYKMAYNNCDCVDFAVNALDGIIEDIKPQIERCGGLANYICDLLGEKDAQSLIRKYFTGVSVGDFDIFTAKNLASFAEDLLDQIDKKYIEDKENRNKLLEKIISQLAEYKVSDIPCTKFIDTLGFGDSSAPGTLGDLVLSAIYYIFYPDADVQNDEFVKDVINTFNTDTKLTEELFDYLINLIIDDLLTDGLLSDLTVEIDALFPAGTFGHILFKSVDTILTAVTGGPLSYSKLLEKVFSVKFIPYSGIRDILDSFLEEYMTRSQYEAIGMEIADMLTDFCTDENPRKKGDCSAVYTYTGIVPVEATKENYRLPSVITTTFGETTGSFNISWYTKKSVEGTDIEIMPYSEDPEFTGIPTEDENIVSSRELKERKYPGLDFGAVGVLGAAEYYNRHIIKISGLEQGKKYIYRVGDARRNWWSETRTLQVEDLSRNVTFFHMSDNQSQNKYQYGKWANILKTAYEKYPEAAFVMNTGDIVDMGSNMRQWAWAINNDTLANTVMMPAAGNHDTHLGSVRAIADNFILPNQPEQNTESGVYYSFDYNNIHIAVLNTNDLNDSDALSDTQISWLKNDMKKSDAQWKFVALHKALYSNGSHFDDDDVCAIRKQLSKLMPQLGIDMVFQGHDHVYLRTDAMDNNRVVPSKTQNVEYNGSTYSAKMDPQGTVYVISACAGVKYYVTKDPASTDKEFPRAEKIVDCSMPAFSAIQIEDNSLYFDAFSLSEDGTKKIDSFAIVKTGAKREKTVIEKISDIIGKITALIPSC